MARTRKPKVFTSTFGWCIANQHGLCKRQFNRYYFDPAVKKIVQTDEIVKCQCSKRGCKCFVKKADRK